MFVILKTLVTISLSFLLSLRLLNMEKYRGNSKTYYCIMEDGHTQVLEMTT